MALILAVGDLHFTPGNASVTDLVSQKILEAVVRYDIKMVVFLGDILHTHEKIHMGTLNRAIRLIEGCARHCTTMVIIGNHDRSTSTDYLTDESPFLSLKGKENICIVDTVISFDWKVSKSKKLLFVFCPYVPPGKFHDALATLDTFYPKLKGIRPDAIFCHQELRAGMGGDEWDVENPLIISGHVHKRSQPQDNILYPGTPYQISYNDESDKGVFICRFGEDSPNITFLRLGIRKKKTIRITPKEVASFTHAGRDDIRLVIHGPHSEIKSIQMTGALDRLIGKGISISLDVQGVDTISQRGKTCKQILKELMEDDEPVRNMYESIFSAKPVSNPEGENLKSILKEVSGIRSPPPQTTIESLLQSRLSETGKNIGLTALPIGAPPPSINLGDLVKPGVLEIPDSMFTAGQDIDIESMMEEEPPELEPTIATSTDSTETPSNKPTLLTISETTVMPHSRVILN